MKKTATKQEQIDNLSLLERAGSTTPRFFRKIRTVGLVLAAAGATLLAAPIALPAIVVTIAGYTALAGTVATAISQAAVES